MLTEIRYMYRDASNYKFHGSVIVDGELSASDLAPFLFDGEFFVPHEVGLYHLLDMPMNEDDHYLHTFVAFSPVAEGASHCSASDLVIRFKMANEKGWFSSLTNSWLD